MDNRLRRWTVARPPVAGVQNDSCLGRNAASQYTTANPCWCSRIPRCFNISHKLAHIHECLSVGFYSYEVRYVSVEFEEAVNWLENSQVCRDASISEDDQFDVRGSRSASVDQPLRRGSSDHKCRGSCPSKSQPRDGKRWSTSTPRTTSFFLNV